MTSAPLPTDPGKPDSGVRNTLRLGTSPLLAAAARPVAAEAARGDCAEPPAAASEFEVKHQVIPGMPKTGRPRGVYEIWTQNRVYHLDSGLVCIRVVDRATNAVQQGHALLGARLVGGRRETPAGYELSTPLPERDTEAVFQVREANGRFRLSTTSPVTRVVLQRYRIALGGFDERSIWSTLASPEQG